MSLVVYQKRLTGLPTTAALDRPVISLAEHIQTAMASFFTVHQILIAKKSVPSDFLVWFREEKQQFKFQCENIRQVLQSCYRHAADYATFSQRTVGDSRLSSAKRCLSTAKGVRRETQDLYHAYQKTASGLKARHSELSRYLKNNRNAAVRSMSLSSIDEVHPGDDIQTLYTAVDGVEESLRDMIAFWEDHISSLVLLIKEPTNQLPAPGEEANAIFHLWTDYQATLLQSSNSISASADALTISPPVGPRRRRTFPVTREEKAQNQDTEGRNAAESGGVEEFAYSLKNWATKFVKPFRYFGKYIKTRFVGNEPSATA